MDDSPPLDSLRGVGELATGLPREREMDNHPTPKSAQRLVDDLKRQAKAAARSGTESHTSALERLARERGYADWHALGLAAADSPELLNSVSVPAVRRTPGGLPVDPHLPDGFADTPNEDRSLEELAAWWEKPFVQTRGDGSFDVRCLDGGAWDRPTWYATVSTLEEADAAAAAKLAKWRQFALTPTISVNDAGEVQVVRLPRDPRGEPEVLYTAAVHEDAGRFLLDAHGQDPGSKGG